MASCNDSTQPFDKTICSICYEDLKPIVEDLQVISICGHVFHELCIQQWFEYPSKEKKKCPICKQMCSASYLSRLNFQSVGDSNLSHKLQTQKEDPMELKLEVRRLEGDINRINSALKSRENDLKITSEKLNKSDLERVKLQERNAVLAKELATLKLVSDLDLEEEEIARLASLGTEMYNGHTVNILQKALCSRNKLFKELLSKYKSLTRDEARSRKELEKAKEQLEKLKEKNKKMSSHDIMKEPAIHLRETKRLRVSENLNNEDVSYILIDDDAPMGSVSSKNVHETSEHDTDNDVMFTHEMPLPDITKEASLRVINSQQAADLCFSAGLVGPDGTKRHLGKWCKKGPS